MKSDLKLWPQILMMILCNISVLSYGLQTAWTTPLQLSFQSNDSPLDIPPMTDDQISWIGSLPSITLTCCAPLFGWIMDRFGRRAALLLATAPNLITYLLLFYANDINIIYASRLVGGFCSSGAFVVGPVYIAECTQPFLKGTLNSFTGFFVKLGIITSITIGSYVTYNTLNIVSGSFTLFFVFMSFWIPESPVFLVKKGTVDEAKSTLIKLWGVNKNKQIDSEIKVIESNLSNSTESKWMLLKSFATQKNLRMASFICASLFAFQMLSGYPAIIRYSVDIFKDAGIEFSPYTASIIMAACQLVSSFFGALLIKKIGHKTLAVWCLAGMASSMTAISVYLYFKTAYPDNAVILELSILPFVFVCIFIILYGAGYGTVPFSMIPILFSCETRATASTVLNIWFALTEFIGAQTFYYIQNAINLSGALAVFALVGFIGVLTLQLTMFEVKNLNFKQIQQKLSGDNAEMKSIEFKGGCS